MILNSGQNWNYGKWNLGNIHALLDHFSIKRTVFVLIVKNFIKNQKFNFPDKLCDIRKKC